ncbi:MAG: hypothetical protein C4583_03110 [Anaerolineaceae bacterium]|nr:MAG: hypothetical protein C4583_03110 [Anaerolineaceae bacterium]
MTKLPNSGRKFAAIALALIVSGLSFPLMLFERALPNLPDDERLVTEGNSLHWLKNLSTECYRADAQWWSKASAFAVLVLLIATSL